MVDDESQSRSKRLWAWKALQPVALDLDTLPRISALLTSAAGRERPVMNTAGRIDNWAYCPGEWIKVNTFVTDTRLILIIHMTSDVMDHRTG